MRIGVVLIATGAGLIFDDPLCPKQEDMRVVEGTSDGMWAPEVVRLNQVASVYAERYNRMLLKERRRTAKPRR